MPARRSRAESSDSSEPTRSGRAEGTHGSSAGADAVEGGIGATGPSWRPAISWECPECYATNSAGLTFCQQCGRLAPSIEQVLLAGEEFFVLDGLKALRAGDEEGAHRCFVLATEHAPTSQIAWYWRARTGETIDEVIACLEEMIRLNPDDPQSRADLELARRRKEREQMVARSRDRAGDHDAGTRDAESGIPGGVVRLDRVRRILLEVASIPSFGLGVLFAGEAITAALRVVGVGSTATLLPSFSLPEILVSVPGDLFRPVAPTFNIVAVVPVLISLWYVRLAFRLADAAPNSRLLALVGGVLALAATPFVVIQQELFLATGIALVFCALAGTRRSAYDTATA